MIRKALVFVIVLLLTFPGMLAAAETLKVGMASTWKTLDPQERDEMPSLSVLYNVYDGLVTCDREFNILPSLAVSWTNPDNRTWV